MQAQRLMLSALMTQTRAQPELSKWASAFSWLQAAPVVMGLLQLVPLQFALVEQRGPVLAPVPFLVSALAFEPTTGGTYVGKSQPPL